MIAIRLARTVIRLWIENIHLRAQAQIEEARADRAETLIREEPTIALTEAGEQAILLTAQLKEATAALAVARKDAEDLGGALGAEWRKRREAEEERDALRAEVAKLKADITPAMSTKQIEEQLYRRWEAHAAHGGDPVDGDRERRAAG